MTTKSLLNAAESWEKIYTSFDQINFTAYDYVSIKQSLLDYLKLYYPENFNDYIESSQMIALIEMFSYVAEIMAYRVDLSIHENLLPTATRKQSILRLAKLISYSSSRNLPLRGLVKITSISTSENLIDSQGNSLSNRMIAWNDQTNSLWREQFFAVFDKVLTQSYGNPFKSFQVDNTVFQQYEVKNLVETVSSGSIFKNGTIGSNMSIGGQSLNFEIVPSDIDQNGVFEREPNPNAYFTLLYADDGYGDSSDTTGFMMYLKQGTLQKLPYIFDISLPNRSVDINIPNINDSDVWVQQVDQTGTINNTWQVVPNVAGLNLIFNNVQNMNKYEIETLENDQIRLIFGDGDFAAMPAGIFNMWVRSSASGSVSIAKTAITDKSMTFGYTSKTGSLESCTFTYSLTTALQNSAPTESSDHIKSVAPSVYYSQNRMVNGQDYNSYLLQDQSILRLNAVNRTFAGQPKYIDWNDASGAYQNIKIFGDDLRMYYNMSSQSSTSTVSSRSLLDNVIEPELSLPGVYNILIYAAYNSPHTLVIPTVGGAKRLSIRPYVKPRLKFIEDLTQNMFGAPIKEKTEVQGFLDRHWYGEPDSIVQLDSNLSDTSSNPKTAYAVVNGDTDKLIWNSSIKCVTQDLVTGLYSLITTPTGISGIQNTVIRQKRFGIGYNPSRTIESTNIHLTSSRTGLPALNRLDVSQTLASEDVYTIEITDVSGTFSVQSSVLGNQATGMVGEAYTNGVLSFIVGPTTGNIVPGDAFIVSVNKDITGFFVPRILTANLSGRFNLIDDISLSSIPNITAVDYDPADPIKSWIFIVERTDDNSGNVLYWTITRRNFSLIVESLSTNFWFNQNMTIVDPATQNPVVDMIRILKSNLDATGTSPIGIDQIYNVVSDVKYSNGSTNFAALSITASSVFSNINTSTAGTLKDPLEFLSFVSNTSYVYFSVDPLNGNLLPIPSTVYLNSLTFDAYDRSGPYARKIGRNGLDFMWQHFTPNDNLIDPSTSNIIDIYVLTSGYYSQVQEYIHGITTLEPTPPSPLTLRNSYAKLLQNKMISDTVIMHSGTAKFIFGSLAIPELRTKFKVLVAPSAMMSGDQIRAAVLNIINAYFVIDNWDFGQSFYATELCAVIHKQLSSEISSVIMVPEFPSNYFGDLYYLQSGPHELLVSCATIDNIEIITSLDRVTLKQKV